MRPTLLEASAGTGKTFSIKHLVLRFVAEEDVSVSRMLIMTFTRAATAELKARIQSHLSAMHGLMTGTFADSAVDAVLLEQRTRWAEQGRDPAVIVSRLRESLAQFDNAGIFTIHGFCQKVLEDRAFTSGSSIGFELVENVDDLVEEVVNEFIRTSLLQLSEREDRAAISDPGKWIEILKQLMAAPDDLVPSTIVSLPESPELAAAFQNFVKEAPKRLAQKKREARVKTFDDLLIELYERLRGDPAAAGSPALSVWCWWTNFRIPILFSTRASGASFCVSANRTPCGSWGILNRPSTVFAVPIWKPTCGHAAMWRRFIRRTEAVGSAASMP